MSCLPDTGCTQTIISSETADLLRLKISNNKPVNLFTANGGSVKVLGSSKVHIANKSVSTVSTVIVADGMSHPALISWHDMIRLKMLPSQFPAYTAALSSSSIQENIFKKFPQVFKDSLTEEPMKTDPVHIHLKENYVPYRVTAARQIPLRFR